MGGNYGARQQFIEAIEPRILLTVFAPDYSFQPPFRPPGTGTFDHVFPISKGRFIISTFSGGGEDDGFITYTRVFADGSRDKTFGQKGSLTFDDDLKTPTFTGSRFLVPSLESAELQVYTVNGKPDESVGSGTGSVAIPFQQPKKGDWSIYCE